MSKFKAGDRFIFHKCQANGYECDNDDFSIGKIYTLHESEEWGLSFRDDTNEERSFTIRIEDEGMKVTKIKENK